MTTKDFDLDVRVAQSGSPSQLATADARFSVDDFGCVVSNNSEEFRICCG